MIFAGWYYTNFDDVKEAEYRYWATQPAHGVMTAVAEMTSEALISTVSNTW
jgi:hypothetical protein